MKLALIGLGKMGANMVRRLRRGGIEVVGYNRSTEIINTLAAETGMQPAPNLQNTVDQLSPPRILWLMVPSGKATESVIEGLVPLLTKGDVIVDGGNANYHDSQRRGTELKSKGIQFIDAGTSGGVWGLDKGYCLMVGGTSEAVKLIEPALKVLAPAPDTGWAHVGPIGAGHFTKMIHNGIEYGMMQAMAEGFTLMQGKTDFDLDLAQIAELWRHGSVVRSWLLDLTAGFLKDDQQLADIKPYVADSGEGRWTAIEAIDQKQAIPVLSLALQMRFNSQDESSYANKLLAMMRNAFGGHSVKKD